MKLLRNMLIPRKTAEVMKAAIKTAAVLLTAAVFLAGCASFGIDQDSPSTDAEAADSGNGSTEPVHDEADSVSGASEYAAAGWQIDLHGADSVQFSSEDYISIASDTKEELRISRKGTEYVYEGIPLHRVIARIDGGASDDFDEELWETGYDITLTAADGYSVTFSTSEVPYDALYLSTMRDGEEIEPSLAGIDVSTKYQVKDLVQIDCSLGESEDIEPFSLVMQVNDSRMQFTREELEMTPYYMEGLGAYTTSAGTYKENLYGGVSAADFISSFIDLTEDMTVTVTASDGYEMSYSGADLLDDSEGEWIFAFYQDGEYLPLDPGYVRTVKIAASEDAPVPNIDGHSSARMIEKISVVGKPLRDFTLTISGKAESVLDRATVQSGINCSAHKRTVSYYNRKADAEETYTGMPLFFFLGYGDDEQYMPHKQTDKSILAYNPEKAAAGYSVRITASDGYAVTLDSRELHMNNDVILAMYQDGEELTGEDWPLKLVWDKDAERLPEGIKAVKAVERIELIF